MNTKIKPPETATPTVTVYDVILSELRSLKEDVHEVKTQIRETRDELNKRMDRLETRMDKIETEVRSSMRHRQILVVSIVGIAIAVIYSVLR